MRPAGLPAAASSAPHAVTLWRKLTDEHMICAEIKHWLCCFRSILKHETETKGCFAAFLC